MNVATKTTERIGYFKPEDFDAVANHIVKKTAQLQQTARRARTTKKLLNTAREAFHLQRYIDETAFFGWPAVKESYEHRLARKFGSRTILKQIHRDAFQRALPHLKGLQTIGENQYVVINDQVWYRTLKGSWRAVSEDEVFLLLPKLGRLAPQEIVQRLEAEYEPTELDLIYKTWNNTCRTDAEGESLIRIETDTTTPEAYFDRSVKQIGNILGCPIAPNTIEDLHEEDDEYLENLMKLSMRLIRFVEKQRDADTHLIHVLRDGMMFAEAQKTLDILTGTSTSSSQVMIGRKLLSVTPDDQKYWHEILDRLFPAWKNNPTNFAEFDTEFRNRMEEAKQKDPVLANMLNRLAAYLEKQVGHGIDTSQTVSVVDTGMQGSVNMLIKYLLDTHVIPRRDNTPRTDVRMYVVGEWFKDLYAGRFESDYYPMMKEIEICRRSDDVYDYKHGSFEKTGCVEVEMGPADKQRLANIELIVLVHVCRLMHELGLLEEAS